MVLFIGSGVDRANIKNFFPMGIGETLIGKGQATKHNQENSNQNRGFHIVRFLNETMRLRP